MTADARQPSTRLAHALAAVVALAFGLVTGRAAAHPVGASRGVWTITDGHVRGEVAFAGAELAAAFPPLDPNGDGALDERELTAEHGALAGAVIDRLDVYAGDARCVAQLDDARLTESDAVVLGATWTCPPGAGHLSIEAPLLGALARGHRLLVRVRTAGAVQDDVLYVAHDRIDVDVSPALAPRASAPHGPPRSGLLAFVTMGLEHILTGYDHLLFLFGLVLVGGRARSQVALVTAFTVGHAATLAVATLGGWAPDPRLVEPAIALSIAYVGLENLVLRDASKRWRVTLLFGLVHGFGFAGALRALDVPRADLGPALFGFNLGVEVGQLAVIALVVPLVLALRHRAWLDARGVRALSGAIAAVGLAWFVARLAA